LVIQRLFVEKIDTRGMRCDHLAPRVATEQAESSLRGQTTRTETIVVHRRYGRPAAAILRIDFEQLLEGAERQGDTALACCRVGFEEEAA